MRIRLVLISILAFALVGCGQNPMVGTWNLQLDEAVAKGAGDNAPKVQYVFKADGTFELIMKEGTRKNVASGTYELKDQRLFMTVNKQNGKDASPANNDVIVTSDFKSFEVPEVGKVVKQ